MVRAILGAAVLSALSFVPSTGPAQAATGHTTVATLEVGDRTINCSAISVNLIRTADWAVVAHRGDTVAKLSVIDDNGFRPPSLDVDGPVVAVRSRSTSGRYRVVVAVRASEIGVARSLAAEISANAILASSGVASSLRVGWPSGFRVTKSGVPMMVVSTSKLTPLPSADDRAAHPRLTVENNDEFYLSLGVAGVGNPILADWWRDDELTARLEGQYDPFRPNQTKLLRLQTTSDGVRVSMTAFAPRDDADLRRLASIVRASPIRCGVTFPEPRRRAVIDGSIFRYEANASGCSNTATGVVALSRLCDLPFVVRSDLDGTAIVAVGPAVTSFAIRERPGLPPTALQIFTAESGPLRYVRIPMNRREFVWIEAHRRGNAKPIAAVLQQPCDQTSRCARATAARTVDLRYRLDQETTIPFSGRTVQAPALMPSTQWQLEPDHQDAPSSWCVTRPPIASDPSAFTTACVEIPFPTRGIRVALVPFADSGHALVPVIVGSDVRAVRVESDDMTQVLPVVRREPGPGFVVTELTAGSRSYTALGSDGQPVAPTVPVNGSSAAAGKGCSWAPSAGACG